MEHQACPFCGGEMRPGGLYLPLRPQPIRWVPADDPFPNVPNGLFPTEAEVMASLREDKPGGKAEPAPEPRPRPGRDPWDKGRPFRGKKKPDWEF